MKKKRVIDLSFIRVAASDTDEDLMTKVRQDFPELLRKIARQIGESQWATEEARTRHTGVKNSRSEREKFIRDVATEYLHDLTPIQREEIALQIRAQLKEKRDLMAGKWQR